MPSDTLDAPAEAPLAPPAAPARPAPARPAPDRLVHGATLRPAPGPVRGFVAATVSRRPSNGVAAAAGSPWTRPALAGRLAELSGCGASAALTFAIALVLDTQRRGETVAWVTSRQSSFFPPDAAAGGVDLAALPVVRVPQMQHVVRAGERLVRCGSFDLVLFDLVPCDGSLVPDPPLPLLTRLRGLAERHDAAVVFLTGRPAAAPSLSSLVSLRVEARRERRLDGAFACRLTALRDKRRPDGWNLEIDCRGPDGLR